MYGKTYLMNKLAQKRNRSRLRYKYYEMKNVVNDFQITTPPKLRWLQVCLGWCPKAVDSLADRLQFKEFKNDTFNLNYIYDMNSKDILFDSAILSALITSCSFIYIREGEDGFPCLQVIDGRNATGIIDPITYMLSEGYAVLERDDKGNVLLDAYFEPGKTTFYPVNGKPYEITSEAPYPLLVPIIFRPDAKRPFGHSRISRACMNLVQASLRTLKRAEISSEFYSFPQKYITGLSNDAEPLDTWMATISSFLNFTKDEDGDAPTLGQFSAHSMSPYIDELKMYASLFAGESGLTLDDLGFITDNPSSAESIKAAHESLRLTARKAQRTFGIGFLNAGYLAACVRDSRPYGRKEIYKTKPMWLPVFEPDSAMISAIGDGVMKIQQVIPGYFDKESLYEITGLAPSSNQESVSTINDVIGGMDNGQ